MGEFLGWECHSDMTPHGLKTVSSSHFGPDNDQTLFWIRGKKTYQGLSFCGHVRAFKYKWNGSVVRGIQLQTFDRRGGAAMLTCWWWSPLLWCFNLFSFYSMSSATVDGVHKFQLSHSAFRFDLFWFGGQRHCGNQLWRGSSMFCKQSPYDRTHQAILGNVSIYR